MRKYIYTITSICLLFGAMLGFSDNVFAVEGQAVSTSESVNQKILLQAFKTCYNNGNVTKSIKSIDSIGADFLYAGGDAGLLPSTNGERINCSDLLTGQDNIFKRFGKKSPAELVDMTARAEQLKAFGYNIRTGAISKNCFYVTSGSSTSSKVCYDATKRKYFTDNSTKKGTGFDIAISGDAWKFQTQNQIGGGNNMTYQNEDVCYKNTINEEVCTQSFQSDEDRRSIDSFFAGIAAELNKNKKDEDKVTFDVHWTYNIDEGSGATNLNLDTAISWLSDNQLTSSTLALNDSDTIRLYQDYLKLYDFKGCEKDDGGGAYKKLNYYIDNGSIKENCYINQNRYSKTYGINVWQRGGVLKHEDKKSITDVVDLLNQAWGSLSPEKLEQVKATLVASDTSSTDDGENENAPDCYSGASSLGWVLCPVLNLLSNTLENIYVDHVDPALKIEPTLLSSENSNAGTYQAWQVFRNIANVGFILLLLFIIFSQLTGLGIDNYGIKRSLPRLVAVAVLVNLSFIVCQIAVDASNIIGTSIKSLLDGISANQALDNFTIENTQVSLPGYIASGGIEAAIGVVVACLGVSAILGNLGLLLPLLLTLLSGVISILFLFLILAFRQAATVILVAIAPIPLVCYILPNTKKLFDIWFKGLKGLLLLYPICGLVIGGGGLASNIILSTGAGNISFFLGISAFLCSIAPIFFIPTLLKGSFRSLGNIGSTISGLGKAFNKGTVGRFSKSDAAKRMQTGLSNWDPGRVRAQMANSRFAKSGAGRIFTANMNRRYAMGAQAQKKQRQEDEAAATILAGNIADYRERRDPSYTSEASYQERMADALRRRDEQTYRAELHEYERHFGASKAANGAMLVNEQNIANGRRGLLSEQNSADFLRRLGADFGSTFAKTPDYARFLAAGGMNGNNHVRFGVNIDASGAALAQGSGTVANSYLQTAAEHGDIRPEQYAGANAQTLTRQMENGFLTQDVAQQIMADKNLTKGMDAVARLMVAVQAESGTVLTKKEAEGILKGTAAKGIDQAHAQTLIRQAPEEVNVVQRFSQYNPDDRQQEVLYTGQPENYRDSRGNEYVFRRRTDGQYIDQNGFEVDITHFTKS